MYIERGNSNFVDRSTSSRALDTKVRRLKKISAYLCVEGMFSLFFERFVSTLAGIFISAGNVLLWLIFFRMAALPPFVVVEGLFFLPG